MPSSDHSSYRSYLLRLWCDSQHRPWRALLQNIRTGETQHFAQPEDLWAYLQTEMASERRQEAGSAEPHIASDC